MFSTKYGISLVAAFGASVARADWTLKCGRCLGTVEAPELVTTVPNAVKPICEACATKTGYLVAAAA